MSSLNRESMPGYWRSLDELAETEEFSHFLEREFPGLAVDLPDGVSRRRFIKLMGASLMLAGVAGCRWPEDVIAPHSKRPGGRLPGVPVHYATNMEMGGAARALTVTSFDGRPIKIEGNREHPRDLGGADLHAQASILDLYDPSRLRLPHHKGREAAWEDFAGSLAARLDAHPGGRGLAILARGETSPTLARLRRSIAEAHPEAKWYDFEPFTRENEAAASRIAFGGDFRADFRLDQARIIVSLDADFLMTHPAAAIHTRHFADRRIPGAEMNRLYAAESHFTVTGTNADHRFQVPPSRFPAFCRALAQELAAAGVEFPAGWEFPGSPTTPPEWAFLRPLARDLAANHGAAVIIPGEGQPPLVHALAHAMNFALGAPGRTVVYHEIPPQLPTPSLDDLMRLAAAIEAGEVETLLILGGNPVFESPADLPLAKLLDSVGETIHLTTERNETSVRCSWVLPRTHYLEEWGDALSWDGTYSIRQPLIAPLHKGRASIEVLSLLLGGGAESGLDLVRETFEERNPGATESLWQSTLRDGWQPGSAFPAAEPRLDAGAVAALLREVPPPANGEAMEIIHLPDYTIYDGRHANNAWLQELPDPVSKVVWENPALVSLRTARNLGARHGDVIRLGMEGRSLEVPAFILPGIADNVIVLTAGYGRRVAGTVGRDVGFATGRLRTTGCWRSGTLDEARPTGRRARVVTTQDHFAIDKVGREQREARAQDLVRELTPGQLAAGAVAAPQHDHHPDVPPLVPSPEMKGEHQWAMTIDLSRCTGCNACVVGCQAENNIPVVGRDQVAVGREMHWLRIDRYFQGDPEKPGAAHQPVPCMQCDNAPCEQVCPVGATMQNQEGLNVMVYNRCVGTRYCSNNCPWKVRRFNYFNLNHGLSEVEKMQKNPEVTVRSRGVMEKCTYCLQRIEQARIKARNEGRKVRDGEFLPACAQTCPAKAIVFGDLNDPDSAISRLRRHNPRDYATLDELGNKPRTRYLARMRNPNPEISEAEG